MLREDSVDAFARLVCVLRRMEQSPFRPESLNAADNNTGPNFAGGLDEGERSNIIEVGGV